MRVEKDILHILNTEQIDNKLIKLHQIQHRTKDNKKGGRTQIRTGVD